MVRRRYSQRNHSDTGTYHRDGGSSIRNKTSINGQIYTVEDRGTAYGHVDIFMGSHSQALSFGMKYADVYQVN